MLSGALWQRWNFLAADKVTVVVPAWATGKEVKNTQAILLKRLFSFSLKCFFTDHLEGDSVPLDNKASAGEKFTRTNRAKKPQFRARIKRLTGKTICFPKPKEIHEKVIGSYPEKCGYHLKVSRYLFCAVRDTFDTA